MAKTRLTNADRGSILNAVIAHKFQPIEAGLLAEENALAIQARAKAYGDFLSVMDAAPADAFPQSAGLKVNVAGHTIRLSFGSDFHATARMFYAHRDHWDHALTLTDADAFGKKIMAWAERAEATKAERSKLRDIVRGTLAAFTTFDDLRKGWPEAERFIVERWATRPEYTANVPAVAIQELSEALDLPPEVAEAA